jgi:hypothetical protein
LDYYCQDSTFRQDPETYILTLFYQASEKEKVKKLCENSSIEPEFYSVYLFINGCLEDQELSNCLSADDLRAALFFTEIMQALANIVVSESLPLVQKVSAALSILLDKLDIPGVDWALSIPCLSLFSITADIDSLRKLRAKFDYIDQERTDMWIRCIKQKAPKESRQILLELVKETTPKNINLDLIEQDEIESSKD